MWTSPGRYATTLTSLMFPSKVQYANHLATSEWWLMVYFIAQPLPLNLLNVFHSKYMCNFSHFAGCWSVLEKTCVHGWVRKIQPAATSGFSKINSTHLHTIMKTKLILNYLLWMFLLGSSEQSPGICSTPEEFCWTCTWGPTWVVDLPGRWTVYWNESRT